MSPILVAQESLLPTRRCQLVSGWCLYQTCVTDGDKGLLWGSKNPDSRRNAVVKGKLLIIVSSEYRLVFAPNPSRRKA